MQILRCNACLSTTESGLNVRTGITGLWDRQTSELVHATIAKRLP
jgi:hypothetical protein